MATPSVKIFTLEPPVFDPEHQKRLWTFYRPEVVTLLNNMEAREDWVPDFMTGEARDTFHRIAELVTMMSRHSTEAVPEEHFPILIELFSQLSIRQCLYALTWLDGRSDIPALLLRWAFEQRDTDASANVLCQRLERVARYHILEDIVAHLSRDIT